MTDSAIPIFEKYLGHHTHVEGGDLYYYCPKCNWKNPRLAVSFDTQRFYCWKCKYGSSNILALLYDTHASKEDIQLVRKILGIKKENKKATTIGRDLHSFKTDLLQKMGSPRVKSKPPIVHNRVELPKSCIPLSKGTGRNFGAKEAVRHLKTERGLSNFEIHYYDIHYCPEKDSVVFPSYDSNGEMNFYMHRRLKVNGNGKYIFPDGIKKSEIIFFENMVDFTQPIILTEGVFDAIKIGFNAIPLLGSFVSRKLVNTMMERGTREVALFLDNDAVRQSVEGFEYLLRKGINVKLVLLKDSKDAGVMSKSDIADILSNTTALTLQEIVRIKSELPPTPEALTTPPPNLNQIPFLNESRPLSRYPHSK